MHRLVLGCGVVGRAIIDRLDRRGNELLVLEPDPDRVETLREDGIPASRGDPAEPDDVADAGPADVVIIAADDPATNRAAAETARRVLPEALLVSYTGLEPSDAERTAIEDVADRSFDRERDFAAALLGKLDGATGDRLRGLASVLRGVDGTLGVFMHDNPDPDAIGSAIALRDLAIRFGTPAQACYFGEITHEENQALVNLLDVDLRSLDSSAFDPAEFDAIALVDHARPGVNNQLPEETAVAVVVDHHPPREGVAASFVDLRSDVGATSTLLVDYYRGFGVTPSRAVATALLYGIRVDTNDFARQVTGADFDAAASLLPAADGDVLDRVENPQLSPETLDTIGRAISNRKEKRSTVVSGVGTIHRRDAISQAADQLLDMEGVTTTLVYGIQDGTVHASARTRGTDLDIGETMRHAFGRIGTAGGHTDMAGAQLSLGILADGSPDDDTPLETILEDVMTERFFEVVGLQRVLDAPGDPIDAP